MNASVVAICVVHHVKPDDGVVGRTAIDKRPVDGPVQIGALGVAGDLQCSSRHGGPDQAVYAYDEAEAQRWATEFDRPVPPGWFGENLTLRGLAVTDAIIGERWQLGPHVQVEITSPRTPCATFARHVEQPRWVRRFAQRGDVGAYLRVLVPGQLTPGDGVQRLVVPAHGVSVREVFAALTNAPTDPGRLAALLTERSLAAKLRTKLERILRSAGLTPPEAPRSIDGMREDDGYERGRDIDRWNVDRRNIDRRDIDHCRADGGGTRQERRP